jgi:hypothetical protein
LLNGEWQAPSDKQYNAKGNHTIKLEKQQKLTFSSLEPVRQTLTRLSTELQHTYPYIHVDSHYSSLLTIARGSKDRTRAKFIIAQPVLKAHYLYVYQIT